MTKVIAILCGVAFLTVFGVTFASVQTKPKTDKIKPDFSGTWLLDSGKNSSSVSTSGNRSIRIAHQDPELRVLRISEVNGQSKTQEFIYYTDGRGEKNKTTAVLTTSPEAATLPKDNDLTESRTKWDGNKVVTRTILNTNVAGRRLEFEVRDEWKLSADGQTLTQTSRTIFHPEGSTGVFIPADVPDLKRIYQRQP